MRNLIVKVKNAIDKIEQEKGSFLLKSLVAKDLSNIQWDLVLSASWIDSDKDKALEYLSQKILGDFDIDCMLQFSGIVLYETTVTNPLIETLFSIQKDQSNGKFSGYNFYGGIDFIKSPVDSVEWIIPLSSPLVTSEAA